MEAFSGEHRRLGWPSSQCAPPDLRAWDLTLWPALFLALCAGQAGMANVTSPPAHGEGKSPSRPFMGLDCTPPPEVQPCLWHPLLVFLNSIGLSKSVLCHPGVAKTRMPREMLSGQESFGATNFPAYHFPVHTGHLVILLAWWLWAPPGAVNR